MNDPLIAVQSAISNPNAYASFSVGMIMGALAKAQGQMKHAEATAMNPHFKSKYANLADVWDAIRLPLASNELTVIQMIRKIDEDWSVVTVLGHSSGEWMKSVFPILAAEQTSQKVGAAISYARRYSLTSMVGISQTEEDDGNADSKSSSRSQNTKTQARPPVDQKRAAIASKPVSRPVPKAAQLSPPPDEFPDMPMWDESEAAVQELDAQLNEDLDRAQDMDDDRDNEQIIEAKRAATAKTSPFRYDENGNVVETISQTHIAELKANAKKHGLSLERLGLICKKFSKATSSNLMTPAEFKFVMGYIDQQHTPETEV